MSSLNHEQLRKLALSLEMSQGEFKLIFAHCNYINLQRQLAQRLAELCHLKTIELTPSATALYTVIRQEVADEKPMGVQVLGLEKITHLEQLLTSVDQVRDEFRKAFDFPLLIWLNNYVQTQSIHTALNFYSWGVKTAFEGETEYLKVWLEETVNHVFSENFQLNRQESVILKNEIEAAREDLAGIKTELEIEVTANLNALLGFAKRIDLQENQAIEFYQEAREGYQQIIESLPEKEERLKIRQGYLLKEIAVCYYLQNNTQEACDYLQAMLQVFEDVNRQELIINSLELFGNLLKNLAVWEQLENLANKCLQLNQEINNASGIAEVYSYLAEVAFARKEWESVINFTLQAVTYNDVTCRGAMLAPTLFIQAKAQEALKQFTEAVESLEKAKAICLQLLSVGKEEYISIFNIRKINEDLYLKILEKLQKLYFEHLKAYLTAFTIKQGIVEAKQRFGQYAFIGTNRIKNTELLGQSSGLIAPEIIASGREKDVETLVERIVSKHYKVIVIYGESGVGKSSLVSGGLVPSLRERIVSDATILPIYLRVYSNWLAELERQLGESLPSSPNPFSQQEKGNLERLQQCQERHRVVLIFDQFEEFFFEKTTVKEQHDFFRFLGECLKILSLKVVFCLRKDYLHYLVDVPGMESIANDVFSQNNLYKIGDFEAQETKGIIQRLTQVSQFKLADDLIEQLVEDLTEDGKVRPIELQIVGAQLQEVNITTLEKYGTAGTKEELVEKYIYRVVEACGKENEETGNLILYLLTDERGTRPLKTHKELVAELTKFKAEKGQLDLVLEILVASGLVVLIPEKPDDRYQLLHDYLTRVIRNKQAPQIQALLADYEKEKALRQAAEKSLQQVQAEIEAQEATKQELETQNRKAKRWVQGSSIAAVLLFMVAIGSGWWANRNIGQAEDKIDQANSKVKEAENKLADANIQVEAAEDKLADADTKVKKATDKERKANNEALTATKKATEADKNLRDAQQSEIMLLKKEIRL